MIPDLVKTSLLTADTITCWTDATLERLSSLLDQANLTLGHVEEFLEAQGRELMLPILAATAQQMANQQPFECPICKRALQLEAKKIAPDFDKGMDMGPGAGLPPPPPPPGR